MDSWNTVAGALLEAQAGQGVANSAPEVGETVPVNPQAQGWAQGEALDYERYALTNQQLAEQPEVTWAATASRYEWNDEYGDVGPPFPDLEFELFGDPNRVRVDSTGDSWRNLSNIKVSQEGTVKITPVERFEDAGLHPVMLRNIELAGYTVPTPVQQYCLPAIKMGYDVIACSQTGSGKTAAYMVPTISKLMGKAKKLCAPRPNPATFVPGLDQAVRAEPLILVVSPNRELAVQIFNDARKFCYRSMLRPCVVYGGGPIVEQLKEIQRGCDVLIGTPGRLCDFIDRPHALSLSRLKYLIIDEADEMLNSDWSDELEKIMSGGDQEIGNITYMMFSATFPHDMREIARQHIQDNHVRFRVGRAGSSHLNIQQRVYFTERHAKRKAIIDLLCSSPPARTMIFVNSKRAADELDDFLWSLKFPCVSIHSDRTQREREDALRSFKTGTNSILIATGVSARGLDIPNVMHVINYDLPSNMYGGIEEYTHRIGRTGRIGNLGIATSFYNERDEDLAEELVKTLLETGQEVPDFLLEHVPEGGADAKLVFAADSDFEDEGEVEVAGATEEATNNVRDVQAGSGSADPAPAPATSGWGASTHDAVASGWGAPTSNVPALAIPVAAAPVASGWNTAVPVPPTASGWGAPPPASFGWGAPTSIPPVFHVIAPVVEPAAPVVASDGWSVPAAGTGWDAPAAPAPGWGSAPPGW